MFLRWWRQTWDIAYELANHVKSNKSLWWTWKCWHCAVGTMRKSQAQMEGRFVLFLVLERFGNSWNWEIDGEDTCNGVALELELPKLILAWCMCLQGTNPAGAARCRAKSQENLQCSCFFNLSGCQSRWARTVSSTVLWQHLCMSWSPSCSLPSWPVLSTINLRIRIRSFITMLSLIFTNRSGANPQDGKCWKDVENNHSATPQLSSFVLEELCMLQYPLCGTYIWSTV